VVKHVGTGRRQLCTAKGRIIMVSDEDGITIVQHCQFLGVPITLPELESTNLMLPPTNAESCCVFSLSISLQSLLGDETSRCLIFRQLLLSDFLVNPFRRTPSENLHVQKIAPNTSYLSLSLALLTRYLFWFLNGLNFLEG